jgi:hypothetical protein
MPLAWVLIAALIAFGGAGLIQTATKLPTNATREEPPAFAVDPAVEPALARATAELQALTTALDALSGTARDGLAMVSANDAAKLQAEISRGNDELTTVLAGARSLAAAVDAIPYPGPEWQLHMTQDQRNRYLALRSTDGMTDGLDEAWVAFSRGTIDAINLTTLLSRHDDQTAAAAKEGTAGHYAKALTLLDDSDATIAEARAVQDRLAGRVDVSTLRAWLDANAAYDGALRTLYKALVDSRGRVTQAVRDGLKGEQAARAGLPKDAGGIVVIVSDVARGGLNQAVIAIEEARGTLAAALDDATPQASGSPGPGDSPAASEAPAPEDSGAPATGTPNASEALPE